MLQFILSGWASLSLFRASEALLMSSHFIEKWNVLLSFQVSAGLLEGTCHFLLCCPGRQARGGRVENPVFGLF